MKRYIGIKYKLRPDFSQVKIIWVTTEQYRLNNKWIQNPSFWLTIDNHMYYAICDYSFGFLEHYTDWLEFNPYEPNEVEFNKLMSYNPIFYKLNYKKAILEKANLDDWCQYELDFCKVWWRDYQLNKIIK